MRKLFIATLAAASLAGTALPAAAAHVDLFVDIAPPPVRYEAVPAPRLGYVWAPGVWEWRHGRHVWLGGHWLRARHGYVYEPAHWVLVNGRWSWRPAVWAHPPHRAVRVY
jgi:hypothetical protein